MLTNIESQCGSTLYLCLFCKFKGTKFILLSNLFNSMQTVNCFDLEVEELCVISDHTGKASESCMMHSPDSCLIMYEF